MQLPSLPYSKCFCKKGVRVMVRQRLGLTPSTSHRLAFTKPTTRKRRQLIVISDVTVPEEVMRRLYA